MGWVVHNRDRGGLRSGLACLKPWPKGTHEPLTFLDLEVLRTFQNQIAAIQRDAVWWLHTVVPSISKLAPKDYVHW